MNDKRTFIGLYLEAKDIVYIKSNGKGQCIVMDVRHTEYKVDEGITKVPEFLKDELQVVADRYLYVNVDRIVRINTSDKILTLAYDAPDVWPIAKGYVSPKF